MRRLQNILLVLENNGEQEFALQRAVSLAVANQARLTVIDVLPDVSHEMRRLMGRRRSGDLQQALVRGRCRDLEKMVAEAAADLPCTVNVLQGTAFVEIIRQVLRQEHDMVIKTVQRQSVLRRMLFGSADMHLLRKCPCPVLLVKPREEEHYRRILAAVDIEPTADDEQMADLNRQILEMASSVAFAEFCELHIVHAWQVAGKKLLNTLHFKAQKEEIRGWIRQQESQLKKRHHEFEKQVQALLGERGKEFLQLTVHMVEGYADQVIPRLAEDVAADLVVMGTVARTGLPGILMGNTAESILGQLDCSVLAVKPHGFQTPVTLANDA